MKLHWSVGLLVTVIFTGVTQIDSSRTTRLAEAGIQTSGIEKREAAYRANNLGVALLEQYKAKEAAEEFKRALEIKSDLLIARINLSIALYYLPDAEGAKPEAERALTIDPQAPQPHY